MSVNKHRITGVMQALAYLKSADNFGQSPSLIQIVEKISEESIAIGTWKMSYHQSLMANPSEPLDCFLERQQRAEAFVETLIIAIQDTE